MFALAFASGTHATAQNAAEPDWQKAAGGRISFEVASVRADKGPFRPPSFALSPDEWFRDPAGRFHADFALPTYLQFAYKISLTRAEQLLALAHQPDWVKNERFAIEATAPPHATKDQYRLMLQSLLADRFALKLHFEQQDQPVLAMQLIKPGKPGPRLIPHAQGQPCDQAPTPDTFPTECYSQAAQPVKDGLWESGSRASTLARLAEFVSISASSLGEISLRVVDRTGLTGLWDYTIEAAPANQASDAPSTGPTMLEALEEQLGLKLKPAHAIVSVLVIDHLARPTEN